jgi:hypothetical protein
LLIYLEKTMKKPWRDSAKSASRNRLVSSLCDKMVIPGQTRSQIRKLVNSAVTKWCRIGTTSPDGEYHTLLDIDLLSQICTGFQGGDYAELERHADKVWSRKYTYR